MKPASPIELRALIEHVQKGLLFAPRMDPFSDTSRKRWHEYMDLLLAQLAALEGSRYRYRNYACELVLGGIRSTSVCGPSGLLSNWIAAAEKHLANSDGTGGAA